MKNTLTIKQIAPCGMDCGLCLAQHRTKNICTGCYAEGAQKSPYCIRCPIKYCELLKSSGSKYCFGCTQFPCARVKHLDKRYRTKYGMSMIENLNNIKQNGIRKFVENERLKWRCDNCGNVVCVHRPNCLVCGEPVKTNPIYR